MIKKIQPPVELDFLLTSECNLRCRHCHMWMNKDADRNLSLNEKKDVIRQFSSLNPVGRVVFCGGEIMLKKNDFLELTSFCNEIGVFNVAVTNGEGMDEDDCGNLLRAKPDVLIFSIDSHRPEVHDWVRGKKGSFERAIENARYLVRRKSEEGGKNLRIYFSQVLMEANIRDIKAFVDFSRGLGIDGVRFQVLLPTFSNYNKKGKDSFFDKGFFQDSEVAIRCIRDLSEQSASDAFILNEQSDFVWMESSVFLNGRNTEFPQCGAFNKTIYLDHEGNYSLCPNAHLFASRFSYPGKEEYPAEAIESLGNFRDIGLADFWYGNKAADARCVMSNCQRICGITPELRR